MFKSSMNCPLQCETDGNIKNIFTEAYNSMFKAKWWKNIYHMKEYIHIVWKFRLKSQRFYKSFLEKDKFYWRTKKTPGQAYQGIVVSNIYIQEKFLRLVIVLSCVTIWGYEVCYFLNFVTINFFLSFYAIHLFLNLFSF